MANTNGTNPYSGSPGEPRHSGRNWKHAHETGGARKPRKKAVPKGQPRLPIPAGILRIGVDYMSHV